MYLTHISHFPFFSHKHSLPPTRFDLLARSFDHALLPRLRALIPQPSTSLSWLSLSLDFLSFAHSQARALLSNLDLSSDFHHSLSSYLDLTLQLLDLCNSISSEIKLLRHRLLLLNFALHLLAPDGHQGLPAPENLRRARDLLSDWDQHRPLGLHKWCFRSNAADLIRGLALRLGDVPRGKISSDEKLLRRTVHAVGLLTVFFAGVVVSVLLGSPEIVAVEVPTEFLWADSFKVLEAAVSTNLSQRVGGGFIGLLDDVGTRVREVCDVIDDAAGVEDDKRRERLNAAVGEMERVRGVFSESLDRLSNGVNGMFDTVLCGRDGMLENVRVGAKEERRKEKQPPK